MTQPQSQSPPARKHDNVASVQSRVVSSSVVLESMSGDVQYKRTELASVGGASAATNSHASS